MARGYTTEDPWRNAMVGMNFLGNAMRTGQQIGEARYEQDERDAVNKAYEYIAGKVGTGDISALGNDPILFTRHGAKATSKFMDDRLKTESSRLEMLKNKDEANDHLYRNTLRPLAFAAQDAFKKNDMQRFGQITGELSAKFPFPYRYTLGQDGNFVEEFRSSKAGKFIDTGERMTPQQVMDSINRMLAGEQRVLRGANMEMHYVNPDFLAAAVRYQLGTIADNAAALGDPNRYLTFTKNGHTIHVVPQNRHDDYSAAPAYLVLDDSGKMGGMIGSLEDLMRQGYRPLEVQAKDAQLRRSIAGRGLGGTGGSGGMAFNLTESDKSWINKVSTTKDDMGNESFNPYIGMSLEILMGKHGLTRNSAFAAYDDAVTQAVRMAKAKNPNASETQLRQIAQKYIYQQLAGGGQSQKRPSGESADKPGSQFMEFGKQVEKATKGEKKQGTSSAENKSPESGHAKMVKGLTEVFEGIPTLFTEGISGNGEEESLDPFGYEPFRR